MWKVFLSIYFLFSVHCCATIYAQCNADSIIYKLALKANWKDELNMNDKESRYLTIDYRPEYPYVLGVNLKKWGIDSLVYKKLLQINDTLSIDYHASYLSHIFQDDPEVIILNKESYKKIKSKNFWKKFWRTYRYSSGQIFVSAIAYDDNCTEAVFYYEIASHWLVGGGFFAVCKFENGEWKLKENVGVLQS